MRALLVLGLIALTGCVKLGLRKPHVTGPWVGCVLLRIDAKGMSGTAKCTNTHDGKDYIINITVRPISDLGPETPSKDTSFREP